MEHVAWPLALLCLSCLAVAIVARERMRRRGAEQAVSGLRNAREVMLRLLRLTLGDQRNLALTLFGHAQSSQPADPALTGLARRLLEISEDLVRQTEAPDTPRTLSEETMLLVPLVEFAVAQVAAQLGLSGRAWRIDPAFNGVYLHADRRALNQVLVGVLSNAAGATRDGDWIEMSVAAGAQVWTIVVQDEGVGLPMTRGEGRPEESRGIGLRLTLARSLMQAHGGSLLVETAEGVGTRVRLCFPAIRIRSTDQPPPVEVATAAA